MGSSMGMYQRSTPSASHRAALGWWCGTHAASWRTRARPTRVLFPAKGYHAALRLRRFIKRAVQGIHRAQAPGSGSLIAAGRVRMRAPPPPEPSNESSSVRVPPLCFMPLGTRWLHLRRRRHRPEVISVRRAGHLRPAHPKRSPATAGLGELTLDGCHAADTPRRLCNCSAYGSVRAYLKHIVGQGTALKCSRLLTVLRDLRDDRMFSIVSASPSNLCTFITFITRR